MLANAMEKSAESGHSPFENRIVYEIQSVPKSRRITDWNLNIVLFESSDSGVDQKTYVTISLIQENHSNSTDTTLEHRYIEADNRIVSTLAYNQLEHISNKIHGLQYDYNESYIVNRHIDLESYGWYGLVFASSDDTLLNIIDFVAATDNATLDNVIYVLVSKNSDEMTIR